MEGQTRRAGPGGNHGQQETIGAGTQLENGLGGLDDLFASEERREQKREADHDAAMRWKSCEKKNHYATRDEAEEARKWCEERGAHGLEIYRCEYCGGWHLTSHPFE